jgi:hypothetical protein
MRRSLFALPAALAVLLLATPAAAQRAGTIRPGMSEAEVRSVFGTPARVRQADGWTYLYYGNRCLPRCGSDDVVFLQDGEVVAAVLRAPQRHFAGPAAAAALRETMGVPATTRSSRGVLGVPAGQAREGEIREGASAVRGIRIETPAEAPARREPPTNLGVIRGRERPAIADTTQAADTTATGVIENDRGVQITPPAPVPSDSTTRRLEREGRVTPTPPRPRP